MDARDFLDQVFLDRQVEPSRRRRDRPAIGVRGHSQPQRREDARNLGIGNVRAQHARQPRATQQDGLRFWQVFGEHGLDHGAGRATWDFNDQARGMFDRDPRQFRVHPTLEAMRGSYAGRACGCDR